jgi:tetratricopeptide (TPR) repeat protein
MRAPRQLLGLGLGLGLAAGPAVGADLKDLYFGEALYHAYQGQHFDALQRLDTELGQYRGLDEPRLDTLHYHINDAKFSVGDFELNYRMHHRAGRAIKAVLEGAVDEAVRNEAAFRLARIHFQKDQLDDALHALARIEGTVPEEITDDVEFLRANIYMATGRPSEAVEVLEQLRCCSNPPTSSGQDSRWTESTSRDRSRTKLCCGQAGPRPRRSGMTVRSFRGTSWWIVSRRMPRFRKRCLLCHMRTPI